MRLSRPLSLFAVGVLSLSTLAACSKDKVADTTAAASAETTAATAAETTAAGSAETTAATAAETTAAMAAETSAVAAPAAGGGAGSLKTAGCPDPLVIQTDWYPEVDHNELYVLAAPGGKIENTKYTSKLMDPRDGSDTGVMLEVRVGGGAVNYKSATDLMYTSNDIFGGYISTDEGVQNSKERPTVAVVAPRERSPQMIMWDPATYPDVKSIADLKTKGVKVRYFDGAAYMDYLTGSGILDKAQADGSYDGSPSKFIADGGKSAQQGFSTAEPWQYANDIDGWKKPVAYQLVADTGWDVYAEPIAVKPETLTKYDACLKAFVPMVQAAQLAYKADPKATNESIVAIVKGQGNDWSYSAETASSAYDKSFADGIIGNGPDATIGNFDMPKIQKIIDAAGPIYKTRNAPIKDGLKPEDVATNAYIDASIGLK
jgi:hypothetical protein